MWVGQGRGIGAILEITLEIGQMTEAKVEIEKEKAEIEKERAETETDPVVERTDKGFKNRI